jgi:transcriptional antiterminator RfaH
MIIDPKIESACCGRFAEIPFNIYCGYFKKIFLFYSSIGFPKPVGISLAANFLMYWYPQSCNVEDKQRDWYVVYSKPHKEEQAQFHLRMKGLDVFFPRLDLIRVAEKRKRIIPLFPNYLFVRLHLPTEFHYVIWSPGVKRIVSFGDMPIPLDDGVVTFLKQQTDPEGLIKAHSQLRPGQEVEIRGGPFDGLIAIIQDPPDGKGRVKILLKLLSRQISVKLGVEFIKGEWVGIKPMSANIESTLFSAVS